MPVRIVQPVALLRAGVVHVAGILLTAFTAAVIVAVTAEVPRILTVARSGRPGGSRSNCSAST